MAENKKPRTGAGLVGEAGLGDWGYNFFPRQANTTRPSTRNFSRSPF